MRTTDYAGIDYGLGKANIDNATGIRFGVISQNAEGLNQDALQDIWSNGRDLDFEQYQAEAKEKLRSVLSDYFSDYKMGDGKESRLDRAVSDAFDAIEQEISDAYNSDCPSMLYEEGGYRIQTSSPNDLFVTKSPYFTNAQFCSPCAPGAGHLESHCPTGPKTYCLGHDWFDSGQAPYPVFSVETGEQINRHGQTLE